MAPLIILDGGMSRELISLGAPFRQPEWSALSLIEAPHFVSRVHQQFLSAGADVITTNSYAIVPFHLGEDRFWDCAHTLASLAGRLARDAADAESIKNNRKVLVAGCLPPIFGSYEPDKFKKKEASQYLIKLVNALAPYVDLWLAETLSLVAEAEVAFAAASASPKPFWVSFTPDDSPTAPKIPVKLRSGETITEAAAWAIENNVDALLFNCARPEYMDNALDISMALCKEHERSRLPLLGVYANTFIPREADYSANSDICAVDQSLSPEKYKYFASIWVSKGICILGGCCGVGHEHIKLLSEGFNGVSASGKEEGLHMEHLPVAVT